MEDNVRPYIELSDGSKWYCGNDNPQIKPLVLAHALGNLCRFTGHCARFYSVAEHLVKTSYLVEDLGYPELAFEALMHDAHEAIVNDLSKPVKEYVGGSYDRLEADTELEVRRHYGLPDTIHPIVKKADRMMCVIEAQYLLPSRGEAWGREWAEVRKDALALDPWRFAPVGWGPARYRSPELASGEAAARWLGRFNELRRR